MTPDGSIESLKEARKRAKPSKQLPYIKSYRDVEAIKQYCAERRSHAMEKALKEDIAAIGRATVQACRNGTLPRTKVLDAMATVNKSRTTIRVHLGHLLKAGVLSVEGDIYRLTHWADLNPSADDFWAERKARIQGLSAAGSRRHRAKAKGGRGQQLTKAVPENSVKPETCETVTIESFNPALATTKHKQAEASAAPEFVRASTPDDKTPETSAVPIQDPELAALFERVRRRGMEKLAEVEGQKAAPEVVPEPLPASEIDAVERDIAEAEQRVGKRPAVAAPLPEPPNKPKNSPPPRKHGVPLHQLARLRDEHSWLDGASINLMAIANTGLGYDVVRQAFDLTAEAVRSSREGRRKERIRNVGGFLLGTARKLAQWQGATC